MGSCVVSIIASNAGIAAPSIDIRAPDAYLRGGPHPPNGLLLFWKGEV